jgi:hypothetical protein
MPASVGYRPPSAWPNATDDRTTIDRAMTDENTDETTAGTDTPDPEGYERVPMEDWEAIEEHLRRIADRGALEASEEEVVVRAGSARFGVTRDGGIDAGMPLHGFEKGDVEALYVDHDGDRIRVYGPDGLAYEFRKP